MLKSKVKLIDSPFRNDAVIKSIFRAVYLFLENNNLADTSRCFLSELKKKFNNVDICDAPVRTIIFRPMDCEEEEVNCENVIICISTNECTGPGDTNKSVCQNCLGNIAQKEENPPAQGIYNEKDIDDLKKTLSKLQDEHINLIEIATQLTSAMNSMEKKQISDNIECKDNTDLHFDSSELSCSCNDRQFNSINYCCEDLPRETISNAKTENVIPLEMKKVTNDIPSALKSEDTSKICGATCTTVSNELPMDLSLAQTYTGERRFTRNELDEVFTKPKDVICKNAHRCEGIKDPSVKDEQTSMLKSYSAKESFELNFDKLKQDLVTGNVHLKLRLLQALRWRLTQTVSAVRDHNLVSYIKNNIMFLTFGAIMNEQTFVESYFCPKDMETPHPLQEEMSRFINTIASLSLGREYLEKDVSFFEKLFLPLLMGKLKNIKIFDLTREFLIATVQKMSLSNKMRQIIIDAGLVEWLVNYILRNHNFMTNYEAEYSSALLMNLCINNETIKRCEAICDKVIVLLGLFTKSPHTCCLPYLPGIYFTLLSSKTINTAAKTSQLFTKLQALMQSTENEEYRIQLEIIIDMYASPDNYGGECSCDQSDEYASYADVLEPELDMHDPIFGEPAGESLLTEYRKLLDCSRPPGKQSAMVLRKSCTCTTSSTKIKEDQQQQQQQQQTKEDGESKSPLPLKKIYEEGKLVPHEYESTTESLIYKEKVIHNKSPKIVNKKMISECVVLSPAKNIKKCTTECLLQVDKVTKKVAKKVSTNQPKIGDGKRRSDKSPNKRASGVSHDSKKSQRSTSIKIDKSSHDFNPPAETPKRDSNIAQQTGSSVLPCRLNYFYNTSNTENMTNLDNMQPINNKYACKCYDSIKQLIDEVECCPPDAQNPGGGRKSNNVVYGPFKPKLFFACACDGENKDRDTAFETRPKINRTP